MKNVVVINYNVLIDTFSLMGVFFGSCCNYHNVLYLVGYGWKYKPIECINDLNEINHKSMFIEVKVSDDVGIIVNKVEEAEQYSSCRMITNVIYNFIITCLIAWPIFYAIINDIMNGEANVIKNSLFQFVFLSQYIIGSIYFANAHFYKILKRNKYIFDMYTKLIYIGLGSSLLIVIVSLILLNIGYKISMYSTLYNDTATHGKIWVNILLIIESFFSYISYVTNMITFSVIMIYHREKINMYSEKIQNDKNNFLFDLIVSITEEFHNMRDEYADTISNINDMFNMLNIFGLIALYFSLMNIYNKNIYIMDIINIVFFVVIETIYIYSINKVRTCISNIKDKMTSVSIITQIMGKTPDRQIISKINKTDQSSIFDMTYHGMAASFKNVEVLNWIVLRDVLSAEWETFNFLGFPITDSFIVQKALSVLIGVIFVKNLSDMVST